MARDLTDFDLAAAMRQLYVTKAYYARLEPGSNGRYEDQYWGEVVDPDGVRRTRRTEREVYLSDVRAEVGHIAELTPGRILDVGCGLGWLLSAVDPRWQRHGLEVSRTAADHASKFATLHVGPLVSAPYDDDFFDVVVMHHVIEHLDDPEGDMAVVRRVLRPGGTLIIGTVDFDSGCARRFGTRYRLLHDETHVSLFSNDSMHRFLRDLGFAIQSVDYPYFHTRHFTRENLERLFDTERVSPPFYGNVMTFYCANAKPGWRQP